MTFIYSYNSPIGILYISERNEKIIHLSMKPTNGEFKETPLIKECIKQLNEYFNHQRTTFTLPLDYSSTPFNAACLEALLHIPYGSVATYKDIALRVNNPKASRAVGNAVHNNPIMIIIPCHRIIKSNGEIGGFAYGENMKRQLLELEGYTCKK